MPQKDESDYKPLKRTYEYLPDDVTIGLMTQRGELIEAFAEKLSDKEKRDMYLLIAELIDARHDSLVKIRSIKAHVEQIIAQARKVEEGVEEAEALA